MNASELADLPEKGVYPTPTGAREMINCQNCGRKYESPSEQTVCMAMYGCCISCNLLNLSEIDLIEIQKRAIELRKAQEK